MLQVPEINAIDLDYVTENASSVPFEERDRAEQVVDTNQFRQWMLSDKRWTYSDHQRIRDGPNQDRPKGTMKLLVHGDFDSRVNISAFSGLCTSLTPILRGRPGFIRLVFFCGCHLERDEHPGPLTMIRSLIGQLLQQYPSCPSTLGQEVAIHRVRDGDIQELCKLFGSLARQVPSTTKIFCMIGGIDLYESQQYGKSMDEVLCSILELEEDEEQGLQAPMKLLLTSSQPTRSVRQVFEVGISLLTMASIPTGGQGPNSTRIHRQMSEALSD